MEEFFVIVIFIVIISGGLYSSKMNYEGQKVCSPYKLEATATIEGKKYALCRNLKVIPFDLVYHK